MASIHREIAIEARPEAVWEALRDVGAIHQRLAPGFVTDVHLEEGARVVTFGNGMVARELDCRCRRPGSPVSVVCGRWSHDPPQRFRPGVRGRGWSQPFRLDRRLVAS